MMCICLRIFFFGIIIIDVFNDEESVILELKYLFIKKKKKRIEI